MSLGPVIEGLAKPTAKSIFKTIGEALSTAALPEAEKAVAPEIIPHGGLRERHVGVPFHGPEEMRPMVRSVGPPPKTPLDNVEDIVRKMKTIFSAGWRSEPDLPKNLRKQFIDARSVRNKAQALASRAVEDYHTTINTPEEAGLLWDHAVASDDYAQALRDGYDTILKLDDKGNPVSVPTEQWGKWSDKLSQAVQAKPNVAEAADKRRQLWDDVFKDMMAEGAITPDRYLEEYTPMRHINGVARALGNLTGDESLIRELSAVQRRGSSQGPRQTNLASLEMETLTRYFQWKAQKNFFADLLDNPAMNFTGKANPGDKVNFNGKLVRLAGYSPGPGAIGYMPDQEGDEITKGILRKLKTPAGGYVMPEPLVSSLNRFNGSRPGPVESAIKEQSDRLARALNVYNPKVLGVNIVADPVIAMMGMPGEKAQPLGILKYGTGLKAGLKYAFTKKAGHIKIGDQIVDVTKLLESEDIPSGTYMSQIKGEDQPIPAGLARLFPESELKRPGVLGAMQDVRQGFELAPRIAFGLDALERTGDPKEFGRVARKITLEYGAGAPLVTRVPILRLMGPFMSYPGLAFERIVDLLKNEGSRGRTLAALLATPVAAYAWNNQNDAYKKVQDAIPSFERGVLPIIMPDPANPEQPKLDIEGKPVVLRFRYAITEDAARSVGLHNLLPRLERVRNGQDTPATFGKESIDAISQNLGSALTMPGLAIDMLSDTDRFGRHRDLGQKLQRVLPQARIYQEAYQGTKDYGPVEGAKRLIEEALGPGFVSIARKGKHLLDARLTDKIFDLKTAKNDFRTAKINKSPDQQERAKQKLDSTIKELRRYVEWRHKNRKPLSEDEAAQIEATVKDTNNSVSEEQALKDWQDALISGPPAKANAAKEVYDNIVKENQGAKQQ